MTRYYRHQELYTRCVACRICHEQGLLDVPFEKQHLPLPWEGEAGRDVRVLFLLARPQYTRRSPRFAGHTPVADFRSRLEQEYERNAIAFKRRRDADTSFCRHARNVTAVLLRRPEEHVRAFQDYLVTSLLRCDAVGASRSNIESAAQVCTLQNTMPLLHRLPSLAWIVPVGEMACRLLVNPVIWDAITGEIADTPLPSPAHLNVADGSSQIIQLTNRVRLVAMPRFRDGNILPVHYDRLKLLLRLSEPVLSAPLSQADDKVNPPTFVPPFPAPHRRSRHTALGA